MNNSSTYKVLKRTLETTNAHIETDKSGQIEEQYGDVSINYNGYVKYDEKEIEISDTSISDNIKIQMRHTHEFLPKNISEKIMEMNAYYKEHKIGPYKFAFDINNDKKEKEYTITIIDNKNETVLTLKTKIGQHFEQIIDPIPTYDGFTFNGCCSTIDGYGEWLINEFGWFKWNNDYIDEEGGWKYEGDLILFVMWK